MKNTVTIPELQSYYNTFKFSSIEPCGCTALSFLWYSHYPDILSYTHLTLDIQKITEIKRKNRNGKIFEENKNGSLKDCLHFIQAIRHFYKKMAPAALGLTCVTRL